MGDWSCRSVSFVVAALSAPAMAEDRMVDERAGNEFVDRFDLANLVDNIFIQYRH